PAIALPVEANEDITLRQVGPVELTWWVGSGAQLEKHGRQAQLGDGFARSYSLGGQLLERRADKDAHALVRGTDYRSSIGCLCWLAFCNKRMICLHSESSPFQEQYFLLSCRFRIVLLKNHNHEA